MSVPIKRSAFVYIKSGDVIADLARIDAASDVELQSGPDAFLFDFLRMTDTSTVLLVSTASSSRSFQYKERVLATTIKLGRHWIAKLICKPIVFVRVTSSLFRAKPRWILCGANHEPFWASFVYARLTGTPLVHSRHNRVSTGNGSYFHRMAVALDSMCIRNCVSVVCHGPYLKKELQDVGVPDSKIHEFDVGLGYLRKVATAKCGHREIGPGEVAVLYSGRVERLKGVFDLLEALEPKLRRDEGLVLLYAGDGAATKELTSAISAKGLNTRVSLLGRLSHHELAHLMAKCKLVVTPTHTRFSEGRCMVVMESLVLGVPVVAPDFGPFPYLVVHGKNGLLYRPDSINDLAQKLDMILDNDELYIRLKAGARESGDTLLVPSLTFSEAVKRAFGFATNKSVDSLDPP